MDKEIIPKDYNISHFTTPANPNAIRLQDRFLTDKKNVWIPQFDTIQTDSELSTIQRKGGTIENLKQSLSANHGIILMPTSTKACGMNSLTDAQKKLLNINQAITQQPQIQNNSTMQLDDFIENTSPINNITFTSYFIFLYNQLDDQLIKIINYIIELLGNIHNKQIIFLQNNEQIIDDKLQYLTTLIKNKQDCVYLIEINQANVQYVSQGIQSLLDKKCIFDNYLLKLSLFSISELFKEEEKKNYKKTIFLKSSKNGNYVSNLEALTRQYHE